MTAYTDFLSDPLRFDRWLVEMVGQSRADGSLQTFYFSTDRFATGPADTPASQRFDARVQGGYLFSAASAAPGTIGILPSGEGGAVQLQQKLGDLDAVLETYRFAGRSLVIRHGGHSRFGKLDYADYGVPFNGLVDQVQPGLEVVTVTLAEKTELLGQPLESRTFPGSHYCIDLDGSTARAYHGSPAKLDITGAITLEAMLYREATGIAHGQKGWDGGTTWPFALHVTAGDVVRVSSSAGTVVSSTATLGNAGRFYHVAVSIDTAGATFYVYDLAADSETVEFVAGSFLSRPAISGSPTFYTGYGGGAYHDGLLRELRVWSAARTADEIRAARLRALTSAEAASSDLKLYVRYNDGTGSVAADGSGAPANGTLAGTYAWRYSLGGGTELEGQVLPNGFGKVEGFEPFLVTPFNHTYQFHSRAVHALDAVRNGGNDVTIDTAYTDLRLFLAASTPAGKYDSLIYAGGSYFRLGSAPDSGGGPRPMTCDFRGEASGAGYVSTGAEIIRRIVSSFGPEASRIADPGGMDTDSFDDLDTANSAVLSYVATERVTRGEAIGYLLQTLGATARFRRADGKLAVHRHQAAAGTPVLTLTERDILGALSPIQVEGPVAEIVARFRRCYRPHEMTEFASAIIGTETQAFLSQEWRERSRSNPTTRTNYPLARTVEIETAYTTEADAVTEADRRLAMLAEQGRAWAIPCTSRAFQLDRDDLIALVYQDIDKYGRRQYRIGTETASLYWVIGVQEDANTGTVVLQVYREN